MENLFRSYLQGKTMSINLANNFMNVKQEGGNCNEKDIDLHYGCCSCYFYDIHGNSL